MQIQFKLVDKEGTIITNIWMAGQPFKVGEIIHLDIQNKSPEEWDVKNNNNCYKVEKIQHYYSKTYQASTYSEQLVTVIEVTEYNEEKDS